MRVVVVERLDMICGGEVRRSMNTRRGGRRQRLEVVRRTIDHAIECHVMGTERHTLVSVACHMSRDDSICYLRERYFQRKELQESGSLLIFPVCGYTTTHTADGRSIRQPASQSTKSRLTCWWQRLLHSWCQQQQRKNG